MDLQTVHWTGGVKIFLPSTSTHTKICQSPLWLYKSVSWTRLYQGTTKTGRECMLVMPFRGALP